VRRSPRAAVVLAVLSIVVAACSGAANEASRSPRTTTSTAPSTTTTTTIPPDLNAVSVVLTPVANVAAGTAMATRPNDPALYVSLQTGQVVSLNAGAVATVLDLGDRVRSGGERGLFGLDFSPDGTKLYVHYSDANGDTTVDEYAFANGVADPATRRLVLSFDQPQPNHNGGSLVFGPDDMLYLALGDGGGANDSGSGHAPEGNAQSLSTLLGKVLRIDPRPSIAGPYRVPRDNPFATGGGRPEIWAYGLRNPWRISFDRETDDVWIGDVGQSAWEEVDMVAFNSVGGTNFGWPLLEGTHDLRGGAAPGSTVLPVFETSHGEGNCSMTGGYVYRGARIPDLAGAYLFTDFCNPAIRAIRVEGGQTVASRDLGVAASMVASFGEDTDGELYVISQADGVFRIDAT
jgi:glucose/arabinose dehydrogenase